jgi:hypothetical protein
MRPPWKIRADIPDEARDLFERFGENVIALCVAAGFAPQDPELQAFIAKMGREPKKIPSDAATWLRERGAIRLRREALSICVQVLILLVAFGTLILQGWVLVRH